MYSFSPGQRVRWTSGQPQAVGLQRGQGSAVVLARSLTVGLAPREIHVNAVSPGSIETPAYDQLDLPVDTLSTFKDTLAPTSVTTRSLENGDGQRSQPTWQPSRSVALSAKCTATVPLGTALCPPETHGASERWAGQ
jgi:NAD(P)-dependent dehydrogenase (short-subunit alcohol dehydrogenase family)